MVKTNHIRKKEDDNEQKYKRMQFLVVVFLFCIAVIIGQLFRIQIIEHEVYLAKAFEQHNELRRIPPARGEIFWSDYSSHDYVPLVINTSEYSLYVVPSRITEVEALSDVIQSMFGKTSEEMKKIKARLVLQNDPYERIEESLSEERKDVLLNLLNARQIPREAYGFEEGTRRYYPEGAIAGHITGFWGFDENGRDRKGQYGLEEFFDASLRGKEGIISGDTDVLGRPISTGRRVILSAQDGRDIALSVDRNIQYRACGELKEAVERFNAQGGVVIIMDPETGKLFALCVEKDFDPNTYSSFAVENFVDSAISQTYEPGSIFKPITMAAALDRGAVTSKTMYLDTGSVVIDKFTIKNANGKSYGMNSMTDVLVKSLNTGAIFAMRQIGDETLRRYVDTFGFGKLTGIELAGEVPGDISQLGKSEIYAATASFGQGISVTPLQIVVAYAAIARGGILVKPTILGTELTKGLQSEAEFAPYEIDRVIDEKTSDILTDMLVSVVNEGHGKAAGVSGYSIAGKTGTAQIPNPQGPGYLEDQTMHSFVGYGPVGTRKPAFVMLVRLDKPTEAVFAENTAAPLFGEIARFLLSYFEIPPQMEME